MRRTSWLVALMAVLALVAAACGDDDDDDDGAAGTTAATEGATETTADPLAGGDTSTTADPLGGGTDTTAAPGGAGEPEEGCASPDTAFSSTGTTTAADGTETALEGGEIGVADTTITFGVYAAVDNPFAPGLAEGNRDAVFAWRDWVNENCGIAGRNVDVIFYDTKLDIAGTEFPAAQSAACGEVLAFIGGYELFDGNVETMSSCPDAAGAPTGLPDLGVVFGEPAHYLNPTSFATIPPNPIRALYDVGSFQYLAEQQGPLRGVWLIPNDLPSARSLQVSNTDARLEVEGVTEVQRFEVGGREENYDPFTQALIDGDGNYAESGLSVNSIVRWRSNVAQLAPDAEITWGGASVGYDPNLFAAGNDVVEGTYTWIQTLPFEERDTNPLLDDYLRISEEHDYKVDGLGFQAFIAGIAMTDVIQAIVDEQGPNAITRAAVLEGLAGLDDYDARGLFGPTDIGSRTPSGCSVLLQAQAGEFVRVFPEERGTLNCEDDNLVTVGEPLVTG